MTSIAKQIEQKNAEIAARRAAKAAASKTPVVKVVANVDAPPKGKVKVAPPAKLVAPAVEPAKASKAKAKPKSMTATQAKAVKQAHGAEFTEALAVTAASNAKAKAKAEAVKVCEAAPATAAAVDAIEKAARAVAAYAERVGIWVDSVCRIAKVSGEYDSLVEACGMEPNETVIRTADRIHRAEIDAVAAPYRPKLAGRSVSSLSNGDGKAPRQSVGRVTVFGHPATAVIRALRAKAGMSFAEIRAVLDANGAGSIADGTIRQQMTGANTGKRGEPAPLTAAQLEAAAACGLAKRVVKVEATPVVDVAAVLSKAITTGEFEDVSKLPAKAKAAAKAKPKAKASKAKA